MTCTHIAEFTAGGSVLVVVVMVQYIPKHRLHVAHVLTWVNDMAVPYNVNIIRGRDKHFPVTYSRNVSEFDLKGILPAFLVFFGHCETKVKLMCL